VPRSSGEYVSSRFGDLVVSEQLENLMFDDEFLRYLGTFHAVWALADLEVTYGIGQALNLSHAQTHVLTAGMEFGPKATILLNLISRADDTKKGQIIPAVRNLQNASLRNALAHGYLLSDRQTVSFIERKRGGEYKAKDNKFTKPEFIAHVRTLVANLDQLEEALGLDREKIIEFGSAALNA
jgi:hypothetical protein